jgi:hypothetical protein
LAELEVAKRVLLSGRFDPWEVPWYHYKQESVMWIVVKRGVWIVVKRGMWIVMKRGM